MTLLLMHLLIFSIVNPCHICWVLAFIVVVESDIIQIELPYLFGIGTKYEVVLIVFLGFLNIAGKTKQAMEATTCS